MTPVIHPELVNDPFGDPALYLDFRFERRAMLFDMGDLQPLSARKLLRVGHAFVSHAHMDHFSGFDRLLRICLGRDTTLHLFGPAGFLDRVEHKLGGYSWNLVHRYPGDFTIVAGDVGSDGTLTSAAYRCRTGFRREDRGARRIGDGVLLDEDRFTVRAAVLDHDIPCLAFALEERRHVNVWKNRLEEMGLGVGPWLRDLKEAVVRDEADDREFEAPPRDRGKPARRVRLGELRERVLRIVPGQKVVYVVDAVHSAANAERIVELARDADLLFIEAVFLHDDADRARERYHLTARQAGALARRAAVRRMIPFHFSPRYDGREDCLRREAMDAFLGTGADTGHGAGPPARRLEMG